MENIDLRFIVYHKLLWQAVLHREVKEKGVPHNCLDDVCASMGLFLVKIEHVVDIEFPILLVQEHVSWYINLQFYILVVLIGVGN